MGDIFNTTRPDSESIYIFRAGMSAMYDAGLPVYAVQGQHDRSNPPWPLAVDANVQYVHQKVFAPISGGPLFYALDNFTNAAALQTELKAVPEKVSVLILHQLMREVFPMEGVWDADTAWLPPHINTLFVGDFHEPVTFSWANGQGWYSGSTYMCKIDEPFAKSVLQAKLTPAGKLDVQRVPLRTRPFIEKNINVEADLDACVKFLTTDTTVQQKLTGVAKPVVIINYLTSVVGVETRLAAAADDKVHLWLRPRAVRLMADTDTPDKSMEHVSMEACVRRFLQDGSPEYQFMMDILKHASADVFTVWREKLGVA